MTPKDQIADASHARFAGANNADVNFRLAHGSALNAWVGLSFVLRWKIDDRLRANQCS